MDLRRLGDAVRHARIAARVSIDDAAAAGGMSPVTWGRVEKAQPVRELTYAGIERALGWPAGTATQILDGQPAPQPGPRRRAKEPQHLAFDDGDQTPEGLLQAVRLVASSSFSADTKIRMIEELLDGWVGEEPAETPHPRRATG